MLSISATQNPSSTAPFSEEEFAPQNTITILAKRCLSEFAVSLALAAICCCFIATPAAAMSIATGLVVQLVISLILKITLHIINANPQNFPEQSIASAVKWADAYCFVSGSVRNAQVVVHEIGHATAAYALLRNPKATITLFPFVGGVTSYWVKQITWLGKKIGSRNIHPIIAGAGPACSLAFSTVFLGLGLMKQRTSPQKSRILIVSGLLDYLGHIRYALSALNTPLNRLSHDFVALWQLGGIHPTVAAITMATIPILILAGYAYERYVSS